MLVVGGGCHFLIAKYGMDKVFKSPPFSVCEHNIMALWGRSQAD